MRKQFELAGVTFRDTVDLSAYSSEIIEAVLQVKPDAEVIINKDNFEVIPAMSKSESIQVSRMLRSGSFEQYTTYRPCLFNGIIIEED